MPNRITTIMRFLFSKVKFILDEFDLFSPKEKGPEGPF